MSVPYRLANGVGNLPDAVKFMANYDFLEAIARGSFLSNGGFENWSLASSFTNPANGAALADSWLLSKTGTSLPTVDVTREATVIDAGVYSLKANCTGAGSANSVWSVQQTISNSIRFKTLTVAFGMKVRCSTASKIRISITDGVNTAYSSYHTGGGTYELLQAILTFDSAPTTFKVTIDVVSDFAEAFYFDSGYCYVIPPQMDSIGRALLIYSTLSDIQQVAAGSTIIGRNRIINGGMQIDQRNAGGFISIASATRAFSVDRWCGTGHPTGGVYSLARNSTTPPSGFAYSMKATVTTQDNAIDATDQYRILHSIEGNNLRDFCWGTADAKAVNLSFWTRSTQTGTYSGSLYNGNGDRCYIFTYAINAANTWKFKTISIPGDTTGTWEYYGNVGLYLNLDLGSGSSRRGTYTGAWGSTFYSGVTGTNCFLGLANANTWEITGVQLELGTGSTPFDNRPFQQELALCQRYYEKSYLIETAVGTNTGDNMCYIVGAKRNTNDVMTSIIYFKVHKRVAPSVYLYLQAGTAGSWAWTTASASKSNRSTSANAIATYGFNLRQQVSDLELFGEGHWAAEAELL